MILRFESREALEECEALVVDEDVTTLRLFLENYRDPPHVMKEIETTSLLRLSLRRHHYTLKDGDRGELVRLLTHYGAESVGVTRTGRTQIMLHFVYYSGEAAALLDAGADIDAAEENGETPLMTATYPIAGRSVFNVALVRFLVRRGANIFLKDRDGADAEAHARNNKNLEAADFLRDMKAAGGSYKKYLHAPRVELLRLRALCDRGRATPPSKLRTISAETVVLQRMFGAPTAKTQGATRLPNEVFWHIISYWCTRCDDSALDHERLERAADGPREQQQL